MAEIMLRKSNFELLRILSMFLIVAHHYSIHGGGDYPSGFDIHKFYIQFLSIGGKLGVNLFVLISGYFLCKQKFNWDRLIFLLSKTWFYSVFIMVLIYSFDSNLINHKLAITSLFPFGYWFVTSFLFMLMLSPIINKTMNVLNPKKHLIIILISTIIIITPPLQNHIGNVLFFIYLYIIGAYFRLHFEHRNFSVNWILFWIVSSFFIIVFSIAIFGLLSSESDFFNRYNLYFIGMKTPFILIISITTFAYFKQLDIGNVKFVNKISLTMFGVYLIHDNHFIRPLIWQKMLHNSAYLKSDFIYLHSMISIFSVFLLCIIIELTIISLTNYVKARLIIPN